MGKFLVIAFTIAVVLGGLVASAKNNSDVDKCEQAFASMLPMDAALSGTGIALATAAKQQCEQKR